MPRRIRRVVSLRCPFGVASAIGGLMLSLLLAATPGAAAWAQTGAPTPVPCSGGTVEPQDLMQKGAPQPDLWVTGLCKVEDGGTVAKPKKYYYGNVYILNGGTLEFNEPTTGDPDINFWASAIIVEANGALTAGAGGKAYGDPSIRTDKQGGFLTIYLYGADKSKGQDPAKNPGQGVVCLPNAGAGSGPCGIPSAVWSNNGSSVLPGCGAAAPSEDNPCIPGLPTAAKDYFYQYGPLYGDGQCTNGNTFTVTDGKALCGDVSADGLVGYFGYKVLAVSYGGTLILNGYKGAATGADNDPLDSGNSWIRLGADLAAKSPSLTLAKTVPGNRWWLSTDPDNRDQIVVTTTDYLPGHSELLKVAKVEGNVVTFKSSNQYFHRGHKFELKDKLKDVKTRLTTDTGTMDPNLIDKGAELRAAVALLTRNIRIVSAGDVANEKFSDAVKRAKDAGKTYYFGGHTIFRQGFKQINIQGVEFKNLGQGGKIGHYPIHFHKARQVPPGTVIKDSVVNESNTRWYVVHDTQGVTLQRDVGWKSIGHGYYLEDGTEADNNFYSDLGIFARAAIDNEQNERKVPGILADNTDPASFKPPDVANQSFPYRSDNEHPSVFWITNGWNKFEGDMAVGAGACGAAYWFVPTGNSDTPDVPTTSNVYFDNTTPTARMKWDDGTGKNGNGVFGYAGLQRRMDFAGATPLEDFSHNYASTAFFSFQTTPDSPACNGFIAAYADKKAQQVPTVQEIESFAPLPKRAIIDKNTGAIGPDNFNDLYYPHVLGGARKPTLCPEAATQVAGLPTRYNCSPPPTGTLASPCANGSTFPVDDPNNPETPCTVTVLDHYTSSFTWAEGNYSGIWLRPLWYLVDNSVITDPQSAGLTFISGGDFTRSSVIEGDWSLLENSILIGHSQADLNQTEKETHKYALDTGPFNGFSGLLCDKLISKNVPNYCLNTGEGVSIQLSGFFVNQRLFSIYDGPAYEASNAYLGITASPCKIGTYNDTGCIYGTDKSKGVLKNPKSSQCYLPNAAIAWKQPNGFFYPPSFHSTNLFFGSDIDIRHFVIDPLFHAYDGSTSATDADFGQGGTYITDTTAVRHVYCLPEGTKDQDIAQYFNSFTGIDRQTELNDDDGTLTGLSNDVQKTLTPPNPLKQTISVNEDAFFTAPVETPECDSNIGGNDAPDNACKPPSSDRPTVTAKTSPYDYVATVVFHPADGATNWDSQCSTPTCYGVPLYRQFLAGTDGGTAQKSTREWKHWYKNDCNTNISTPQCRWPFIRMAGENIATRETLTVNNGTYYIDTAVPLSVQKDQTMPGEPYNAQGFDAGTKKTISIDSQGNVFVAGQTYTVFFLFAKKTTRQTYQVYLGKKATAANIKPVRINLLNPGFTPTPVTGAPAWLSVDDKTNIANGIIDVTVDFTKVTDGSLDPTAANGMCQPRGFCKSSSGTCVSTLATGDPRKTDYDAVCGEWAVKDLDCPRTGCYGFTFTIPTDGAGTPAGFNPIATVKSPTPYRLQPTAFPMAPPDVAVQGKPTWLVKFFGTTVEPDQTKGQCHYTTLPTYPPPGMNECTVPDWVPTK